LLPDAYLDQFTYEEETQDWMNLLSKVDHDVVYVAVDDADHILGYALGRSLADSGFDCELLALHVLKDHQRQGIGTALVSVMASHYADTGCASLMLWTLEHNPVRAMYETWGGEVVNRRSEMWDEGTQITEVAYGWSDIRSLIRSSE
jgi:GNAT superfamily N-acetyltransferase